MPAKKQDDPKYKPFIGRVFILRKFSKIPTYSDQTNKKVEYSYNDIGDAVLILDESNVRVRVTTKKNDIIWIPKFFLHEEVEGNHHKKSDSINAHVKTLLEMSEFFMKNPDINDDYSNSLKKIAVDLKQIADEFNEIS